MQHLRLVALPALFVAIGVAGACSVYDESLLGGVGGGSTSSGDGGETGDGGAGPTTDGSSTASGSTGNVTTGGGCTTVDECPGEDSACAERACVDGVCSIEAAVQGVELPDQTTGDCVKLVCDGAGGIQTVDDDADVPADDGNGCTASVCVAGAPDHVAIGDGEACSQDGGRVCLGEACVACIVEDDCDGLAQCSDANTCVDPQCNDGSSNGLETGTDCGGPDCDPCPLGQPCDGDGDCLSGECNVTCQPSCTDGVTNNGETDQDCGGPNCAECPLGDACALDSDCDSDQCLSEVCRPRLFFSEYVEGEEDPNKAVEIYNFGNVPLDLAAANCFVRVFFNGSMNASSNIGLTGTIVEGEVAVLCNPSFVGACTQSSGSLTFNGDDAIALECDGVVLDVFGRIGEDPGTGWGGGVTENVTLRRNGGVDEGDPVGSDAFNPAEEWVSFAADTYGGLGSHP